MNNIKNPYDRRCKGFFTSMLASCVLVIMLFVPRLVFSAMLVQQIVLSDKSLKKAEEVLLLPMGGFDKKTLTVDSVLEVGDEISCTHKGIVVVLGYLKQGDEYIGEYKITSPFKAMVVPATSHQGDALAMLEGTADVLATDRTEIHAGEVTLGSERTQYGIKVVRSGSAVDGQAFVFEGKVKVKGASGAAESLATGEKLQVDRDGNLAPVTKVDAEDIRRAATLFARVDLDQIERADLVTPSLLAYFTRLHGDILESPGDGWKILELVEKRLKYGIYSASSLLYLDHAFLDAPPRSELWKRILFFKAKVLYVRGEPEQARDVLESLLFGFLGVSCE